MSNRYKMNRIGFVNFWLYDEEDFEFADGKLLLRGQNGSGKSITTQSFIPFVLDGDRTPSRLDPFGSSDRRMEYYFLGEEGRDEATGYLFLEFKKEETGEYRTIGIGQRAKRGKPMDFWGFIILDGRRIGRDLWLYKEVGSTRIPYDKRELRAVLGEDNYFTDSQSEYKKHVNQYLFGFRKEEQYEQFIKLLVKVRAPKLSKEFKPTKVYEILNDSLQTLTDEDLRAMVDAMEKMDEIQDSLEMLNRAFGDVKIIRNEYMRYNQYMLGKKALGYLAKKKEADEAKEQLDLQEVKKQRMEEETREKTLRMQEIQEQKKLAETEMSGLMDTDLEEMDHKLEQTKADRTEAQEHARKWENKIESCKEQIRENKEKLKEIQSRLEMRQQELLEKKEELEEQQEILQWDQHQQAIRMIGTEQIGQTEEIAKSLEMLRRLVDECRHAILKYEELGKQYDEASAQLEQIKKQKIHKEQELEAAQEQVLESVDQWVTDLYDGSRQSEEWHPQEAVLQEAEERIRQYQAVEDALAIQEILRKEYERQRQSLTDQKNDREHERRLQEQTLIDLEQELSAVEHQEELEPERDEVTKESRMALEAAGITAVPFYKTVEFSEQLETAACARLEAQLQRMGLLDALVVSEKDLDRIQECCPQFLDSVIYVKEKGNSDFSGLTVSEELGDDLKAAVRRILSNIYESQSGGNGIYLGKDGCFVQGILAGKADKAGEAEFVGLLARKHRKEQRIKTLKEQICQQKELIGQLIQEIQKDQERRETLQEEYRNLPGFGAINGALEKEKQCSLELQMLEQGYVKAEAKERDLFQRKNEQYQTMLKLCKPFPYGRTSAEYGEVMETIDAYRGSWQEISKLLIILDSERSNTKNKEEQIEDLEQAMDEAFAEKRQYTTKIKSCEIQIRQIEDYLNRPDIVEKANRLKELREALKQLEKEYNDLDKTLAVLADQTRRLLEDEPRLKEKLSHAITEETYLKKYFEEELFLNLVFEREDKSLVDCAKKAVGMIREGDKDRGPEDLLQSLYQVYQKHNGSLANYGTALEDCFDAADGEVEAREISGVIRKRVRVMSVWNGKKVYLEEFYNILKTAIEETELLIQERDRELFEDILSQTISQQLTDRIAESRKWVADMWKLMKAMDTSMGLKFSLEWKPKKAENDAELDTVELEQILLRDKALLTMEDIEKVASHFRSRIRMEKAKLEEDGSVINYMELVRDALDYRKWFEFQMFFKKGEEPKKPLTNAAFNRFSGGEKAMAMYVPLFAAVNAQYQKAENEDHPRMIALDEAFAGVDDKNISSMFELVHKLDFDYIMNSQALWGCFTTVKNLRIAELLRPLNSQTVSVIRYTWNGHERILDEQ